MNKTIVTLTGIIAVAAHLMIGQEVTPYINIRSQGLNTPRHVSGEIQQIYATEKSGLYGTFSAAFQYSHSFDNKQITQCLFGNKNCPTITISGSHVENRGDNDWLADYFYLPTDYKSTLSFKPSIDNILVDFNFYISLDTWVDGLYFAVYAPLVHSRWHLNMNETIDMKGTSTSIPGYYTPDTLARNDLLNSFAEYAAGQNTGPIEQTFAGTDYAITFDRLRNARISPVRLNQTRLADLRTEAGYNFLRSDWYRCGIALEASFPTGNRPEGEYLFEPVIGNGHHWELGVSLNANVTPWQSQNNEKQIILYSQTIITHLFAAQQCRTFDLDGKPFSRYMLAQRVGIPVQYNLKGDGVAPVAQFDNEFLPIANLSRLCVDVSTTIQAEFTAMCTFVCDNFSWDLGYNFWARSCDSLQSRRINPFENNTQWALKGDAQMFGYDRGAAGAGALVGAVPLSATQNNATINHGTNKTDNNTFADAIKNPGIDNATNSTGDGSVGGAGTNNNPLSAQPFTTDLTIKTSINPVLITKDAISLCNQVTKGLSNSLFTHFSYTWQRNKEWMPYLGLGGQVEFGKNSNNSCDTGCQGCMTCSISQWGIWIKGGLNF
jgi:hypothetical protein